MHDLEFATVTRFETPISVRPEAEQFDANKRRHLECDVIHKVILTVQSVLKQNPGYSLKITDDPHRREFNFMVGKWVWPVRLTDLKGSRYSTYFASLKGRFELEDKINERLPLL